MKRIIALPLTCPVELQNSTWFLTQNDPEIIQTINSKYGIFTEKFTKFICGVTSKDSYSYLDTYIQNSAITLTKLTKDTKNLLSPDFFTKLD